MQMSLHLCSVCLHQWRVSQFALKYPCNPGKTLRAAGEYFKWEGGYDPVQRQACLEASCSPQRAVSAHDPILLKTATASNGDVVFVGCGHNETQTMQAGPCQSTGSLSVLAFPDFGRACTRGRPGRGGAPDLSRHLRAARRFSPLGLMGRGCRRRMGMGSTGHNLDSLKYGAHLGLFVATNTACIHCLQPGRGVSHPCI